MSKIDEFKENLIFLELKDKPIMGSEKFKTYLITKYNYGEKPEDYSKIRSKIINYQIDTYGASINDRVEKKTKEEIMKIYQRRNNRKYLRRQKYEQ
jgi:hypothetical protein